MAEYGKFLEVIEENKHRFGIEAVKKEQVESLFNFVCKKDVFVNIPTGFGKWFIYQIAPFVHRQSKITAHQYCT